MKPEKMRAQIEMMEMGHRHQMELREMAAREAHNKAINEFLDKFAASVLPIVLPLVADALRGATSAGDSQGLAYGAPFEAEDLDLGEYVNRVCAATGKPVTPQAPAPPRHNAMEWDGTTVHAWCGETIPGDRTDEYTIFDTMATCPGCRNAVADYDARMASIYKPEAAPEAPKAPDAPKDPSA